ncbi:hypothetical protein NUW54_g206 [Trametes sanguinea]|uniref:Uncharacterized protein n=1 Tax=Trametes sanguinea TaxID=158606 RepID=A0ACC1QA33_9APHY|nr:hypothetical protein NUW54_g206 [Trametes sanguinea]
MATFYSNFFSSGLLAAQHSPRPANTPRSSSPTTPRPPHAALAPEDTTPTPKSRTLPHDISIPTPLSPDARCARCNLPLFSRKDGGKFVTVPEQPSSTGVPPKTYHASCFRCTVCDKLFQDSEGGRAVFVRSPKGACHVQCAPPEKIITRTYTATMPKSAPATSAHRTATATYHPASTSRYEPPPKTAPASRTDRSPSRNRVSAVRRRVQVARSQYRPWNGVSCLVLRAHAGMRRVWYVVARRRGAVGRRMANRVAGRSSIAQRRPTEMEGCGAASVW